MTTSLSDPRHRMPGSPDSRARLLDLAEQAENLLALRADPRPWIEANLQIRTKDQRIIPFRFNWAQAEYWAHRTQRDIILKPRQLGFTTLICATFFADCVLRPNTTSVIVAHDQDSTERIFRIVRLFWERLPEGERRRVGKPRYSTRRELLWPKTGSEFFVGTAGSLKFGRGHTIHNLHCSEFAFWPKPQEALVAIREAVPQGGRIIVESTANGVGNYFHDLWTAAKEKRNDFKPHFYVWWEDPEYSIKGEPLQDLTADERRLMERWKVTHDQIRWRRWKQKDLGRMFEQEYPEDDLTCFMVSGRCCFDMEALRQAKQRIAGQDRAVPTLSLPGLKEGRRISMSPARLLIWKNPIAERRYVVGADVGEGLPDGDASCGIVLDRESGEQVAELHGRIPPERFGHLLDALGRWYNLAVIAVERNNHGHSTLNTLRNTLRYRRLYWHNRYDQSGRSEAVLGWPTDSATKPILVDDLAAAIADGSMLIHSDGLVGECMSFITTDSGAQEAQPGKFDDRVIAAGIAWQARKRRGARGHKERPPGW